MSEFDFEKFKPFISDLIKFYYEDLENAAGGNLHIALDDGNLSDGNIWFCQERCEKAGDTFGYFLATLLRYFSEEEREQMYKAGWYKRE